MAEPLLESPIARWTHREFLTRLAWLDEQWNRPARSDYYLMRVAQRVQQVLSRSPNSVGIDDQRVRFESEAAMRRASEDTAAATRRAKAGWAGLIRAVKRGRGNGGW